MPNQPPLETATGGHRHVPPDWMPASRVEPLIREDPAVVWLDYYGADHGFAPDTSPYAFADFIAAKAQQFEEAWLAHLAPGAVRVWAEPEDGRDARKVRETWALMRAGTPVIAQPTLWWAPERIYGLPDLLAHSTWLQAHLPGTMDEGQARRRAPYLGAGGQHGHYVVLDLKFTTRLDERSKAQDLAVYAAQVRLYSHMLGQLQGLMPAHAYLVARDRLADPLPVDVTSAAGGPLDADLAAMRDQFVEIKLHGERYLPWRDAIVRSNLDQGDARWATAKKTIARDR